MVQAPLLIRSLKAVRNPAMGIFESALESWTPGSLSVLRGVIAYLFLQQGKVKRVQVPRLPMLDQLREFSRSGSAGMVSGLLMLLGLFTRPVLFILSGEMLVIYFVVRARQGRYLTLVLNGRERAAVYSLIVALLAATVDAPWSIDVLVALK
jgi:putative oxidoreductase